MKHHVYDAYLLILEWEEECPVLYLFHEQTTVWQVVLALAFRATAFLVVPAPLVDAVVPVPPLPVFAAPLQRPEPAVVAIPPAEVSKNAEFSKGHTYYITSWPQWIFQNSRRPLCFDHDRVVLLAQRIPVVNRSLHPLRTR